MRKHHMWLVRAGEGGYLVEDFLEQEVIAIGWNEVGDLSNIQSPQEVKQLLKENFPEYKDFKISLTAGQMNRFRFHFQQGDNVVTYDYKERLYHIGKVCSDYKYDESYIKDMFHLRDVEWFGEVSRDDLSMSARNTLGASLTIIVIQEDVQKEINRLLKGSTDETKDAEEAENELDIIKEDIIQKAHEFTKDKVLSLSWEDMQELVAGLLRGMGYKTRVSSKGPDRGRDIIASPDGLGLEEPRILVEVKHRAGQMGAPEIRSFTGGLRTRDKGLYVSTGGFSKEAKYEAERSNIPITLVDADILVELIIQYYDQFDVETKTLIPLQKIYWPV